MKSKIKKTAVNVSAKKITKDMSISEIFESFPSKNTLLSEIITDAGLHCVGCSVAAFETLEEGAMVHGFTNDELNILISDLNNAISVKKK